MERAHLPAPAPGDAAPSHPVRGLWTQDLSLTTAGHPLPPPASPPPSRPLRKCLWEPGLLPRPLEGCCCVVGAGRRGCEEMRETGSPGPDVAHFQGELWGTAGPAPRDSGLVVTVESSTGSWGTSAPCSLAELCPASPWSLEATGSCVLPQQLPCTPPGPADHWYPLLVRSGRAPPDPPPHRDALCVCLWSRHPAPALVPRRVG